MMTHKMNHWFLTALMLVPLTLAAAHVDTNTAKTIAQQFVNKQSRTRLQASHVNMMLAHAEPSSWNANLVDYFIFNSTDGNAFVIIAGEDRAEQVLGYGDGAVDVNNIPCGMRWLLEMYKEQIEYLHSHPGLEIENSSPSLKDANIQYLPLLTCDWSQGTPYNNQCPEFEGERCVTGCVATAMAQVMYFWRYPESCPSIPGYKLSWVQLPTLPATTFIWNKMLDIYTGHYTESQAEAVAKLMRYCGQSCSMNYGVDGSGAYVSSQLAGMKLMGYNRNASMVEKKNYSVETWNSMMLRELADGYPILYSGSGQAGGHAFVLDGYDGSQNKYHVNWGWASTGNGYFALGAFNVRDYSFNSDQQMLVRIYPSTMPKPNPRYDFEEGGIYYNYDANGIDAVVTCESSKFNTYSGEIVVPSKVTHNGKTMTVTAIGDDAFRDCVNLTKVTLPSSIKHIGAHAFRSASALTEIVLSAGLESIGNQSFTNCISLQRVYLPSSVREIGYKAFLNCSGLNRVDIDNIQSWIDIRLDGYYSSPLLYAHRLFVNGHEVKHLEIPESNTTLADYKFAGFSGMTSLSLPAGLTNIGKSTFAGCSSLTMVDFPESLSTLGAESFKNCTGLQELVITEPIQRIDKEAFAGCNGMMSVTFNGPVEVIETDAFAGCDRLNCVIIPDIATWFGNGFMNEKSNPLTLARRLFVNDKEVTALVIPESVSVIGDYMFYSFTGMTSVVMRNNVKKIGKNAFALCKGLTRLTISDGVTEIGEKAFSTCSNLKSLTIGSRAKSIGDKAFIACTGLTGVTCRSTVPPPAVYVMWFSNVTCNQATLMVPKGSLENYKKANEWSRFSKIIGIDILGQVGDVNGDGEINIADVNVLVDIILKGTVSGGNQDVNSDGEINIADVNTLVNIILQVE